MGWLSCEVPLHGCRQRMVLWRQDY